MNEKAQRLQTELNRESNHYKVVDARKAVVLEKHSASEEPVPGTYGVLLQLKGDDGFTYVEYSNNEFYYPQQRVHMPPQQRVHMPPQQRFHMPIDKNRIEYWCYMWRGEVTKTVLEKHKQYEKKTILTCPDCHTDDVSLEVNCPNKDILFQERTLFVIPYCMTCQKNIRENVKRYGGKEIKVETILKDWDYGNIDTEQICVYLMSLTQTEPFEQLR